MKKFLILSLIIAIILLCVFFNSPKNKNEYLRIHIRANSNSVEDQNVKYVIKDKIVDYLTPLVANCDCKQQLVDVISSNLFQIECISNQILAQNNFGYKTKAYISNEFFPTRTYEELTLESGFYDAIIMELGLAEGDNWWCVVYPPLCFSNTENIVYKSKILELIRKYFY